MNTQARIVVIGGGFTGLSAAYELTRLGFRPTLIESDAELGGLAGSFPLASTRIEKFYHHWFTNDTAILDLIDELGLSDQVAFRPSKTGMFCRGRIFRLSSPADLLKFSPLGLIDRIRLGRLVLRARAVKDWQELESLTAEEWLIRLCGPEVFRVVWQPLLRGKFGPFASDISAVWFWNKLKLRGSSRGKGAREELAYFHGGFAALVDRLADAIRSAGGTILTNCPAQSLEVVEGAVRGVCTPYGSLDAQAVIATPALPILADLVQPHVSTAQADTLRRIEYLANVCVVLQLNRPLSDTYWLNVNDPGFPFVGVMEHTNLVPAETYGGKHVVFLSRYLPHTDPMYRMPDQEVFEFCLPHLQRMFPRFSPSQILGHHVWRARYSQPVVERNYSRLIPPATGLLSGLHVASMAQIYPEDRGTNYAVRQGRLAARQVAENLK